MRKRTLEAASMSGPIRIDPAEIRAIAANCRTSSETMTSEAGNLRTQVDRLHEALQGIPSLAMADHFQELNGVLNRLSQSLDQSNSYLTDVVNRVDDFVRSLGQR
jgi:WXG100 family type VII secretion target